MNSAERIADIAKEADTGCAPYYDMIPALIRERGYNRGIEIGVFVGGHAKAILDNSNLRLLIGIDPYRIYEQGLSRVESQEDFDCIYSFAMNRIGSDRYIHLRMTSDEAYPFLSGNMFDFVFIDGLHTYEQVRRELNNYSKLIRKGGVIACHDYRHPTFPQLTVAIDNFAEEHNTGVILCPFHAIYMEKTW
jgi:predicted O-methyltransferase YrrM